MHNKKSTDFETKGEKAFFLQKNYLATLSEELSEKHALKKPCYTFWSKNQKLKKWIDKVARFLPPYHFYWYIHTLAGKKVLLPASNLREMGLNLDTLANSRLQVPVEGPFRFKRISIQLDGLLIDAMLIGTEKSLQSDRWLLFTNGNAEFYENKLQNSGFYQILEQFQANALIFNYPGVGASQGSANRFLMRRSSLACMAFLEDSQKGVGAKEIIGFGHSIGGAAQGELTLHHSFKPNIRYAFIKSRTFCSFAQVACEISNPLSGFLVALFGWNMKTAKSSRRLKYPELILQSALVHFYVNLAHFFETIKHDGIIPKKTSLAYALLKQKRDWKNKSFIGIFEGHNQNITHPKLLYEAIMKFWSEKK